MSHDTLEERVSRLEKQMDKLMKREPSARPHDEPGPDDWKTTVGMFRGDPVVKEMIDEAAAVREEERQRARDQSESDSA
jgi:hypothetical protein